MRTSKIATASSAQQRRSRRVLCTVLLYVSGQNEIGVPFEENTSALIVNAHGGLILLKEPVSIGQTLTIKNIRTAESLSCTVVMSSPAADGMREVGVEFSAPNPAFWRVAFPPDDWTKPVPRP